MRILMTMTLTGAAVWPVAASEVRLSIEIPQLTVAEYHRPYVAVWLERADQSFVGNVAVWYDLKLKDNEGTKWLKDLRQWWRRSGRELSMPVDGLSTATRPPGNHQLKIDTAKMPFAGPDRRVIPDGRRGGARSRRARVAAHPVPVAAQGYAERESAGPARTGRRGTRSQTVRFRFERSFTLASWWSMILRRPLAFRDHAPNDGGSSCESR